MLKRPLYHNLIKNSAYFRQYHAYFDQLLTGYFESGRYEMVLRQAAALIAPYVEGDPTAFCAYEDHQLAVETLLEVCRLRGESVRGQLSGRLPATLAAQREDPEALVDASHLRVQDLGDFGDLEQAAQRQNAARRTAAESQEGP